MTLLVFEYVTGGGMLGEPLPRSLVREAGLMLDALLEDLLELPDLALRTTRDPRLPPLPPHPRLEVLSPDPDEDAFAFYRRALEGAEAAWPTAPESEWILEHLGDLTIESGARLIGSDPAAVHLARHKWRTARLLDQAGVPVVPTYSAWEPLPTAPGRWVVKPKDGAGAQETTIIADWHAAERALLADATRLIAQPWIEGDSASLSLLVRDGDVELLACNRQRIEVTDGRVALRGLEVNAFADADGRLHFLARQVVAAMPGLAGYLGIDLLLTADGPRVLEVNPRLTTSYAALREALGVNVAHRVLRGAGGSAPIPRPGQAVKLELGSAAETVLGWDLGGAHLKAGRLGPDGRAEKVLELPCPLWQGLHHLEAALREALATLGPADRHAITMTGEMVDLFPNREEGVARILEAVRRVIANTPFLVYAGATGLVAPDAALALAPQVASANWMATAAFVARCLPKAILVDVGSTTADLIPVAGGRVLALGRNDFERLTHGELVYTGVVRTPVMAMAPAVAFEGHRVPLMAEYFATSADIYRLTGELPEGADLHPAADQGEKTVAASARRLARMIGRDAESAPLAAWQGLARELREAQLARLLEAFDRQLAREGLGEDVPVVGAGVGRFLADELARRRGLSRVSFASLLPAGGAAGALIETCAPAVAVGALAQSG
jgi:probable H4MPT-linked C1 transfer pathway protein